MLLKLINAFSKIEGYRSIYNSLFYLHVIVIKNTKVKLRNQLHLQYHQKEQDTQVKFNKEIQVSYNKNYKIFLK